MPEKNDQAAINAAILQRLEMLDRKLDAVENKPAIFGRAASWCRKRRAVIMAFVAGVILGGFVFPFVSGRMPSPIDAIRPVSSLEQIVRSSPNDPMKRRSMATEYRTIAEQIRDRIVTSPAEASDAVKMATAHVRHAPDWKKTVEALDRFVGFPSDISVSENKYRKIGDAFSEVSP